MNYFFRFSKWSLRVRLNENQKVVELTFKSNLCILSSIFYYVMLPHVLG